ncbi:hypothetical protein CEE37_03915 [candidate division LCP-89 bacterium B3_LCP]|uniref:Deacetylase sirtuin-type domain-containing protein n=1 Tax=candidate division LCP-89 bacterium B3_LCP TaxID=2012998 RepID=A0A532V3E5_UNCL8|nr:MAG: hypothetical protein CEE37_03915 [candidate division LCP-89 bacterium B3_LCP]
MARTVLILGAGASVDAGAPVMNDFLDVSQELLDNNDCDGNEEDFELVFKAISRMRQLHEKVNINVINLEEVFSAIEMGVILGRFGDIEGDELARLSKSLKRVICTTLERTMKFEFAKSDDRLQATEANLRLMGLLKRLEEKNTSKKLRSCVITFNYDLAIDIAFMFRKIDFTYCLDETNETVYPFLKLHGSLNWGKCRVCEDGIGSTTIWEGQTNKDGSHCAKGSPGTASHCGQLTINESVIVSPTWNKLQQARPLRNIWRRAAQELSEAQEIIIIGYSFPDADIFFKFLYALGSDSNTRVRRFIIGNPDESVEEKFRNLIGSGIQQRFEFIPERYNELMLLLNGHQKMTKKYPKFRPLT